MVSSVRDETLSRLKRADRGTWHLAPLILAWSRALVPSQSTGVGEAATGSLSSCQVCALVAPQIDVGYQQPRLRRSCRLFHRFDWAFPGPTLLSSDGPHLNQNTPRKAGFDSCIDNGP